MSQLGLPPARPPRTPTPAPSSAPTAAAGAEPAPPSELELLRKALADVDGLQGQLDNLSARLTSAVAGRLWSTLNGLLGASPRAESGAIGGRELVSQVLSDLADPASICQGDGTVTCTITSLQVMLARSMPDEYARIVGDLLTTGETRLKIPGLWQDMAMRKNLDRLNVPVLLKPEGDSGVGHAVVVERVFRDRGKLVVQFDDPAVKGNQVLPLADFKARVEQMAVPPGMASPAMPGVLPDQGLKHVGSNDPGPCMMGSAVRAIARFRSGDQNPSIATRPPSSTNMMDRKKRPDTGSSVMVVLQQSRPPETTPWTLHRKQAQTPGTNPGPAYPARARRVSGAGRVTWSQVQCRTPRPQRGRFC